ncbi:hypothetical protein BU16DRAFT_532053 [Lophium mytilinum]|uniref:Uncharacterized protein n=1 Tax=Lophium mytilinum TaxID=390894 RepID=A0A6A6QC45_9PEZI|nr:hypothetical protein BU16DRAFT_532053 [Lophium mytilinum]
MELTKIKIFLRLSFLLPCIALRVHADDEYEANEAYPVFALPFPKPPVQQYQVFYDKHDSTLANIFNNAYNVTLHDYRAAFDTPTNTPLARQLFYICQAHERCMLDKMSSDGLANFNSAGVVLGLMPTLLSTIGLSVAETSLLSSYRPLLSFLLSLGAPAVWPTRLLEYSDPTHVLCGGSSVSEGGSSRGSMLAFRISPRWAGIAHPLSAAQYLLAAGAAANVMSTSVELGRKTILSWDCTVTFGPLLWGTLACVVHVVSAVSFGFARRSTVKPRTGGNLAVASSGKKPMGRVAKLARHLRNLVGKEITLCAEQEVDEYDANARVPLLAVLGNVLAGCVGFVHLVLGVIVFSSLQFETVREVLSFVLWQYVVSSVVCRLILVFEIGGLRREKKGEW